MPAALKRRIARLENIAPLPHTPPQWITKANECPELRRWLWLVISGKDGEDSARQQLQDRFGDEATAIIAEHTAYRRQMMELDDC